MSSNESRYFFNRLLSAFLPALAFFSLYTVAFVSGSSLGLTSEYSHPLWLRWDSFHYLSIAKQGYQAEACGSFVCGNTGWFPLYPLLIKLGSPFAAGSLEKSSIIVIFVTFMLLSFVLSKLVDNRWSPLGVSVALVILPGGIYRVSAFPITIMLLFCMLCLFYLKQGKYLVACIAAVLASLSYPSAILFATCVLILLFDQRRLSMFQQYRWRGWLIAAFFPIGFLLSSLFIQSAAHIENAYALTQARYGHSAGLGFETLRSSIKYFYKNPIFFQTFLVLLLLVLCVLVLARSPLVRSGYSFGLLCFGCLVFFLTALAGDTVSAYRQESLIAPLFIFIGSYLPRSLLAVVSAPLVLSALMMARLFFEGVLV